MKHIQKVTVAKAQTDIIEMITEFINDLIAAVLDFFNLSEKGVS